jgi:carbamoyltransferase
MASRHSERATGVDISDRALKFAQVNAALNGARAGTRFLEGDLYQAVPGERFDLIVANPPWIATPNTNMELYRWGGETGEVITKRVVEGLPEHLNVGGTLSMFVIYPIVRGQVYLDRFRSWLPPTGWGVALAESTETSLENFIRLHLEAREDWGRYLQECATWMDAYDRHGIERMGIGMAYVRRLPEGRPGWGAIRKMVMPPEQMSPLVERWLDGLERVLDPAWTPDWDGWRPEVSDRIGRIWRDIRSGEGTAEFRNPHWGAPVALSADETRLVEMLAGGETAGQIADRWGSDARERVRALLRGLAAREVV